MHLQDVSCSHTLHKADPLKDFLVRDYTQTIPYLLVSVADSWSSSLQSSFPTQ